MLDSNGDKEKAEESGGTFLCVCVRVFFKNYFLLINIKELLLDPVEQKHTKTCQNMEEQNFTDLPGSVCASSRTV